MQKLAVHEGLHFRLAEDSAGKTSEIYRDALTRLGVDCRDMDSNKLPALLTTVRRLKLTRRLAFDAASNRQCGGPLDPREAHGLNIGKDCSYCGAKDGEYHATGCKEIDDAKTVAEKLAKQQSQKTAFDSSFKEKFPNALRPIRIL